jgi:tetratricopeptide (TPR) repeat protein
LAGFLFALHPVAVESVAWIAEQKNTLSTLCSLAAALAWLKYEEDRRPARYAAASGWFLAALLTKTVTATLPAALLVLAWWRRGRLTWREDVRPLLPWLVAGAAAGLFTVWFERTGIGAQGAGFEQRLLARALLAGRNLWFYLGTLLWPANLAFHYPPWSADPARAAHYLPALAALLLLAALAWHARRQRGPLAAALLFGGMLFPALGFFDVYPFLFSPVADHFQYLASLAAFTLLAAGLTRAVHGGIRTWSRPQVLTAGTALVAGLAALTFAQSRAYADSVALYRATLARSPDSWIAHHNLAVELAARGDPGAALPHARRAVELKPDFPAALNNLADNLARTGQPAAALPLVERALQLQPKFARAENTHGVALALLGRREEAAGRFQRAIALEPGLAEAHHNLGLTHAESGRLEAAIACFARTLQLQPDHAGAELNWGLALALADRLGEARGHFERALELDPDSAAARQVYARILLRAGERDEAAAQLRAAWELDPTLPGLREELQATLPGPGRR